MATLFYLDKQKAAKYSNPNLTDHLWVSLNVNRNVPRKYSQNQGWKASPDNASIDVYDYIARLTKKASPLSSGSYATHTAAYADGLGEGAIFYNSTTGQLEVLLGQGAYADDASAATGGISVGEHYFNTSTNNYTTRMV